MLPSGGDDLIESVPFDVLTDIVKQAIERPSDVTSICKINKTFSKLCESELFWKHLCDVMGIEPHTWKEAFITASKNISLARSADTYKHALSSQQRSWMFIKELSANTESSMSVMKILPTRLREMLTLTREQEEEIFAHHPRDAKYLHQIEKPYTKEFALRMIAEYPIHGSMHDHLFESLPKDKDVAMVLARTRPSVFEWSQYFLNDEDVATEVATHHPMSIEYFAPVIRANADIMRIAIRNDCHAFKFTNTELNDDINFVQSVLEYIKKDGTNMDYIGRSLRSNHELMLQMVQKVSHFDFIPDAVYHAKEFYLRMDPQLLKKGLKKLPRELIRDPDILRHASK